MTTETKKLFDVLVSKPETQGLRKIGTAFSIANATGLRFTLKANVAEGDHLVILPSRRFDKRTEPAGTEQQ